MSSWFHFCQLSGESPECIDERGNVYDDEHIEDMVANYMTLQCGIRKLAPDSITGTYLPGIVSAFGMWRLRSAKSFRAAVRSEEVKLTARGFQRQFNKSNPKANRIKLPYCLDMALKSKQSMTRRDAFKKQGPQAAEMLQARIFLGQLLGIVFMLRKSEYIYSPKATATELTRRHVTFFDHRDKPIPYHLVGEIKARSVVLNIEFAKADASGYGRRNKHIRQDSNTDACPVCILESWFVNTRDNFGATEDLGLFDVPRYGTLTVEALQTVMQWTINDHMPPGQKTKRVTSHSLRYGGATMMAAAGYPHYIIAIYGGWSADSKALRIYTRPSEAMTQLISAHMGKMAKVETSIFFMNDAFVIAKARQGK